MAATARPFACDATLMLYSPTLSSPYAIITLTWRVRRSAGALGPLLFPFPHLSQDLQLVVLSTGPRDATSMAVSD
jgi:hypothetical protein